MSTIRMLRCKLTPEAMAAKATQVDALLEEVERLENERGEKNKDYKSRIARKSERIKELANDRRQGSELRQIECEEIEDEQRFEIAMKRLDTGEIFDRRAMTRKERQKEIPGTDGEETASTEKPKGSKPKASAKPGNVSSLADAKKKK